MWKDYGRRTSGVRNLRLRLWLLLRLVVAAVIAFALVGGWTIVERTWLYPYDYRSYIETSAAQQRADPFLVAAVIKHESKFQPTARSDGGAVGLMQLMPQTAAWIAARGTVHGGLPLRSRP